MFEIPQGFTQVPSKFYANSGQVDINYMFAIDVAQKVRITKSAAAETTLYTNAGVVVAGNTADKLALTIDYDLPVGIYVINSISSAEYVLHLLDPSIANVTTTTTTPTTTTPKKPARSKADRKRISRLNFKLRKNEPITKDDVIFLTLGNSELTTSIMATLTAGKGFDGLIDDNDLSESTAYRVLAVYMPTATI